MRDEVSSQDRAKSLAGPNELQVAGTPPTRVHRSRNQSSPWGGKKGRYVK
jgi:hypothetical protein